MKEHQHGDILKSVYFILFYFKTVLLLGLELVHGHV